MKYYPMHMHLHSIHQPGASMTSHIHNAKELGMEYIRFTDHDTRTGRKNIPVRDFDFSKGVLVYNEGEEDRRGWELIGAPAVSFSAGELIFSSSDGYSGLKFFSSGKRHTWALLSDITVTVGMEYEMSEGARIIFDFTLSQRPPEHELAHYRYVIGEVNTVSTHLLKETPMPAPDGGVYRIQLSRDMEREAELGGLDNTFSTLSILIEGEATVRLDRFEIDNKYEYNDLILRQRALAEEIGERYHVKPFVTTEISGAGQHKNCFSSSVPVINYFERGYKMSEEESCEYLRSHGAVFSYNHPFEAERYKRRNFTREEIENIIAYETNTLAENGVYGAAAIEVGFPMGRGLFTLSDYLRLWDNLSLRGIFITGDGDSDSHFSHQSWFEGNNFATWIGADENLEFPISEQTFNESILSGNCYMGDPTVLRGEVSFLCGERQMGSAVRIYENCYDLTLRIDNVGDDWEVRYIRDGEVAAFETVSSGNYRGTFKFIPDKNKAVSFVRAELYDNNGRCIMLTNPIYFLDNHYRGTVPVARAGYIGSPAQSRDTKLMNSSYEEEIDLPDWLSDLNGRKILHIGDTESWRYGFYRKLIALIKPDVIIHTGDMADEVKAGRMTETAEEYKFKVREMFRMLRESGAEIIIVPGNNDLKAVICELLPEATVVANNTKLSLDGVDIKVGHEVANMVFDLKWSFYGHGFTGDLWLASMNKVGGPLRFNACNGPVICSLSEEKFHQFLFPDVE